LYNYRDHSGERLTLRSAQAQVDDLEKILDKHGVHGEERTQILAWHSVAYGLPYHLSVDRQADLTPPGSVTSMRSSRPQRGPRGATGASPPRGKETSVFRGALGAELP